MAATIDDQELICISSDEEDGQEGMVAKGNGGKVPISSNIQDLKKEDEDKLLDITSDEDDLQPKEVVNGKSKKDVDHKDSDAGAQDTVEDIVQNTAESKNKEKIDAEKTTDPVPDDEIKTAEGRVEELEKDVDGEEMEEQLVDEEDDIEESSRDKLNLFFSTIKPYLTPSEYNQVETKINKLYDKLELIDEVEYGLIEVIEVQLEGFEKDPKKDDHVWTYIKMVVEFIKDNEKLTPEKAKAKREKLTRDLEAHLKKLEKKIKDWDVKEVDLDEEENSAYMIKARLENKYIKYWKSLCHLNNCNSQTDRPIFKKISMKDACAYPDINNEVEVLLNTKKTDFTPDYIDIKKLITEVNASKNLNIEDDKIAKLAENIFKQVMKKVKARRNRDMLISLPVAKAPEIVESEAEVDPAELDEDLAQKLEENSKNWNKMKELEDEFVVKQLEEGKAPIEYEDDDDLNDSFSESDDESESSLLEYETGDRDQGSGDLRINPCVLLRDEDMEDDEEDEDEYFDEKESEPPAKRQKISNILDNTEQMEKSADVDVEDGQ